MAVYAPVIFKEGYHAPMGAGDLVNVDHLPLDPDQKNLLKKLEVGFSIKGEDLVSGQAPNWLSVAADGKLYVAPQALDLTSIVSSNPSSILKVVDGRLIVTLPSDIGLQVSEQTTNLLRKDADGKLLLEARMILSDQDGQILTVNAADGGVYLSAAGIAEAVLELLPGCLIVSADEGNAITAGSDGGAYLDVNDLPSSTIVSEDANNIITKGSDGGAYLDEGRIPDPTIVSTDAGNLVQTGTDGGALLTADQVVSPERMIGIYKYDQARTWEPGQYADSDGRVFRCLLPSTAADPHVPNPYPLTVKSGTYNARVYAPIAGDFQGGVEYHTLLHDPVSGVYFMFARTINGYYTSSDGVRFSFVAFDPLLATALGSNGVIGGHLTVFANDNSKSMIILVTGEGWVLESSDSGNSWSQTELPIASGFTKPSWGVAESFRGESVNIASIWNSSSYAYPAVVIARRALGEGTTTQGFIWTKNTSTGVWTDRSASSPQVIAAVSGETPRWWICGAFGDNRSSSLWVGYMGHTEGSIPAFQAPFDFTDTARYMVMVPIGGNGTIGTQRIPLDRPSRATNSIIQSVRFFSKSSTEHYAMLYTQGSGVSSPFFQLTGTTTATRAWAHIGTGSTPWTDPGSAMVLASPWRIAWYPGLLGGVWICTSNTGEVKYSSDLAAWNAIEFENSSLKEVLRNVFSYPMAPTADKPAVPFLLGTRNADPAGSYFGIYRAIKGVDSVTWDPYWEEYVALPVGSIINHSGNFLPRDTVFADGGTYLNSEWPHLADFARYAPGYTYTDTNFTVPYIEGSPPIKAAP